MHRTEDKFLCEEEIFSILFHTQQNNPILFSKITQELSLGDCTRFSSTALADVVTNPHALSWMALPRLDKLHLEKQGLYVAKNQETMIVLFKQQDRVYHSFDWRDAKGFSIIHHRGDCYALSPHVTADDIKNYDHVMECGLGSELCPNADESQPELHSHTAAPSIKPAYRWIQLGAQLFNRLLPPKNVSYS